MGDGAVPKWLKGLVSKTSRGRKACKSSNLFCSAILKQADLILSKDEIFILLNEEKSLLITKVL